MSAILIIAPMLAPMASAMGIDPIHMGIIFIVNLEIGYLTPPVGLNLFVSSSLFKKDLGFVVRAVLPTLGIMLASLAVITWVPPMSLALVDYLKEKPGAAAQSDSAKPAEPSAPSGAEGVKSLEELMRARKQPGADAAVEEASGGERVKSLEELMRERKQAATDPAPSVEPASAGARVKSLEELMRENKQRAAPGAAPESP
jgi:hypothetical protein